MGFSITCDQCGETDELKPHMIFEEVQQIPGKSNPFRSMQITTDFDFNNYYFLRLDDRIEDPKVLIKCKCGHEIDLVNKE